MRAVMLLLLTFGRLLAASPERSLVRLVSVAGVGHRCPAAIEMMRGPQARPAAQGDVPKAAVFDEDVGVPPFSVRL